MSFFDKQFNRVFNWESIELSIREMADLIQKEIIEKCSDEELTSLEKGMRKSWILGVGVAYRYYPSNHRDIKLKLKYSVLLHTIQEITFQDAINQKEYFVPRGKRYCDQLRRTVLRRIAIETGKRENGSIHSAKSTGGGKYARASSKAKNKKGINVFLWVAVVAGAIACLYGILPSIMPNFANTSKTDSSIGYPSASSGIELSNYIGLTLSECKNLIPVEFQGGGNNIYYVEQDGWFSDPVELFRCTFDDTGKIVKIHLKNSGEQGYTLFGVTTTMDEDSVNQVLQGQGLSYLCDDIWLCANEQDAVYRENTGWCYEIKPDGLQETILYADTINSFVFQYEGSEGAYYLGSGQMLEYYYDSFAKFMYQFSQLTEYQRSTLGVEADGRYIYLWGEVTSVYEDGTVQVFCNDEEAMEELGAILPITGSAKLHIVSEQESELLNIRKGDQIAAFGKISTDSYTHFLTGIADLNDTVLISVNSTELNIPIFQRTISGITRYGQEPNISNSTEQDNNIEQGNHDMATFESCSSDQLIAAYEENKFRAEDTFLNTYIELTGKIQSFSSYGYNFDLEAMTGIEYHDPIECEFDSDLHLSKVADLQVGDIVTIRCKVTQVGGVTTSYTVEVLDFVEAVNYGELFWLTRDSHIDPMTGLYVGPVVNGRTLSFAVYAGIDANGNVTYCLNYQTGSETIESDGEYYEVPKYIDVPSDNHSFTNRSSTIVFDVGAYYPEYSGELVLNLQYTSDGTEYTVYANIPGILDTEGETLFIGKAG